MTPQPPHDLFVSERPVRSDYARERSYARRRIVTVSVLILLISFVVYMVCGRHHSTPAEIPTIRAEGPYKQKPTDPGGIDIPHQDVRVYDALESKNAPSVTVEHLLPPPETPQESLHNTNSAPVSTVAPTTSRQPIGAPSNDETILSEQRARQNVATTVTTDVLPTVTSPPSPIPVSHNQESPLDKVIEHTKANVSSGPSNLTSSIASTGSMIIQLASSPDETKAQSMMKELQEKYATQLGGLPLHLSRADLGSRGIYYRIQSQGLSEDSARQVCSSLKQINAGCILVRK